MDGENSGKPYEQMDDLGVPLFLETPEWSCDYLTSESTELLHFTSEYIRKSISTSPTAADFFPQEGEVARAKAKELREVGRQWQGGRLNKQGDSVILLMAEILHQLISSFSHYL